MKYVFKLHPAVLFLASASLLNDLSSEIIYPLLPIFLTTQIGASFAFVGLIEGIGETTASMLKLYSGYLSDRIGRKRQMTIAGYFISNITRPLIGLAGSPLTVLIFRFLDRVGKGVRTSPRDAIIATVTDEKNRGMAYGFHRSMDNMGSLLGSFMGFVLLTLGGLNIRTLFLLAFIPGILSVLSVVYGIRNVEPKISTNKKINLSLKPFSPAFKKYIIIIGLFTLGNSSDAFLILKAKECGLTDQNIPLLWMALSLVRTLLSTPLGMLSDKINRKKVIITGWIIYAAVYIAFAYSSRVWHIWVLFCIYGLYYAFTEGVEKALIADLVNEGLRGTAFGIYNFTVGIVALPSSIICGLIWEGFGSVYALGFGALLAFVASIVLIGLRYEKN